MCEKEEFPKLLCPQRKKPKSSHYPISNINEQEKTTTTTENKDALGPNWNILIGFNN